MQLFFFSLTLGCILVLLTVVGATFLSNIRTQVPFVPTPRRVALRMVSVAKLNEGDRVYDLGAGDARLLVAAKRACKGIRAVGYELALGAWLLGKCRMWLTGSNVLLKREDFFLHSFQDADVIFLYLTPMFMNALAKKFDGELRPGTRVISHCFQFSDRKPKRTHVVHMPLWGIQKIHVYEW